MSYFSVVRGLFEREVKSLKVDSSGGVELGEKTQDKLDEIVTQLKVITYLLQSGLDTDEDPEEITKEIKEESE